MTPENAFNKDLFFIIFGVYMAGMVVLGWWVSRGQKSGDDFLLGGRKVPFLLVLGTTIASLEKEREVFTS